MKVLNVNHLLNTKIGGGTAERTIQMSYYLASEQVDCKVLSLNSNVTPETMDYLKSVNVLLLPNLLKRFYVPSPQFIKIYKAVKESDVIHLMNHWTLLNVYVYLCAKILKKPYVLCPAGSLSFSGRSHLIKKIFNLLIGNSIIANASILIAVTEDEAKHFQSIGVDSSKIEVIPNGIQCDLSPNHLADDFRKKYNLEDKKILLYMGRMNPIKGPDLLLEAYISLESELRDYDLVFCGTDEGMVDDLKIIAKEAGVLDRIHFINFIQGDEKEQAYSQAELLVIPSRKEAMSIVVLEAGIYSTPVVVTDQCGLNDLEGISAGTIVKDNPESIAEGLQKFLNSKDKLSSQGENLKEYVLKNFDWKLIAKNYINLYRKILN